MAVANYSDLLVQITRLLYGEDISASNIPQATLAQALALAEKRVYREVRSRHNEKAWSAVTVTGNLAPLPDDFESCSLVHFGKKALVPAPEDFVREALLAGASGDASYFAQAGSSLYFAPAVADATAVQGRYFYRYPDLDSSNFAANALMEFESDVFIYATLVEAAPLFEKAPDFWEAKYQSIRDRINSAKNRTAYSAGRIQILPSTSLMG